jgi:regulatory protein
LENEPIKKKIFSRQQAKIKAENYCAYQERSQYEIRNKLYEWGLYQTDVEEIISELIESNFLNEERFALAYTLGKFRIKQWGKIKIKHALKLKKVPDRLIHKSLQSINDDDYINTLKQILEKKGRTISDKDPFKLRYLLSRYASGKGFEMDLISDLLISNKLEN